jgi:hypothetical protein
LWGQTALTNILEESMDNNWPDPTQENFKDPRFDKIWNEIKTWDINAPEAYQGYCEATGNYVKAILNALDKKEKFDMHDMFKDSSFWKPIIIFVGGFTAYFTLLYFLPKLYSEILAFSVIGAFFLGMLFFLGKSHYDLCRSQIKSNYKKLTGKDYDTE